MPFVQRNSKGEIVGLFTVRQPHIHEEYLLDDHPEIIKFRANQPPLPEGFLKPLSEAERHQAYKEGAKMEKQIVQMRNAIHNFLGFWSNLEVSLSALLHAILGLPKSQIAYAIYYSPTSFDGRATMLDNAFRQYLEENEKLNGLLPSWQLFKNDLDFCRKKRNDVAHGSPIILDIRNKKYLRLSSPTFDVNKIGRKVKTGTIPGTSLESLLHNLDVLVRTSESADLMNGIISAYRAGELDTCNKKSYEFADHLQKIVNLRSGGQTPQVGQDPLPPSPE